MKIWESYLKKLDKEFGIATIEKWLRNMRVVNFDARNLYLEASDSFQVLWFNEHIKGRIDKELLSNGRPIRVHIRYKSETEDAKSEKEEAPSDFTSSFVKKDNIFKNFLVHEGATLPFKLLEKLDFSSFNPIVIYGPKGCGKTHLLQATAEAVAKQNLNVYYITTDRFTKHVVRAMRGGEMNRLRDTMRNVDAWIVDDVDELSNRLATQEEFFHTFNTHHMAGKPVILSMSKPPQKLEGIEPRLVSRFEWGIALPLTPPTDLNPLLRELLKDKPFQIDPRGLAFLLETFTSPHFLAKAIELITYHSAMRKKKLYTLDDITPPLADLTKDQRKSTLTPEKIIDAISRVTQTDKNFLTGKSRAREIALPRQIAMYLIRKKLGLSYTKIADLFNRDHTTAMSSINKVQDCIDTKDSSVLSILKKAEQ
ncbi:MAG: DnaA/Hda family protein [Simkaniaceae bacterium]|nr:DnaA/Hda family protein [Simkaniaceae bacterium]